MRKRFIYLGLSVLCSLGFLLSYAEAADQVSVEFKLVCAGSSQSDCRKAETPNRFEELYVSKTPFLSTKDIASAKITEQEPNIVIDLRFNKEATQKFNEITSKNAGRRIAVFLDGSLLTTSKIYDPVTTGKITITTSLTKEKAKALVDSINK
ncbi:MAG: hypothetical protein PHT50_02735 [Candidatus Omnitrophica bacterium]|nr:hypothetical protein [Candidatus Omnitrophota bacterium]